MMNRNAIAIGLTIALLAIGGLCLVAGDELASTQLVSVSATPAVGKDFVAGAINGNVPSIAYDTNRAYTMIVLPANGGGLYGKQIVELFGGDPTIRNQSVVRIHNADAPFLARWGGSFPEAVAGTPTVCVLQEAGGQVRSVYKMPMGPETFGLEELKRVQAVLASICPCTPKPAPTPGPGPGPMPNNQPTMPPLNNTPPGTGPADADDKSGLVLIAIVGLVAGAMAYYARD